MKQLAPEFRALITIFRSTGPVISTRRSVRSGGGSGTRHSLRRTFSVSGRNVGEFAAIKSRLTFVARCQQLAALGDEAALQVEQ